MSQTTHPSNGRPPDPGRLADLPQSGVLYRPAYCDGGDGDMFSAVPTYPSAREIRIAAGDESLFVVFSFAVVTEALEHGFEGSDVQLSRIGTCHPAGVE